MSRVTFFLDLGTGTAKIQAGDAEFPYKFSTIAARPRLTSQPKDQSGYIFDREIKKFKGIIQLESLISPYEILLPKPFREFLVFIFSQVERPTEDANLVVGVPSTWSNDIISNFKKVLFQAFDFHSIYCAPSEVFSLNYYNLEHCTLLDSGYETTRILQFKNQKPTSSRVLSTRIAGSQISKYLQDLIKTRFPRIINKQFARYLQQIKVTKCFLAKEFEKDLGNAAVPDEIAEEIVIPGLAESLKIGVEKILTPEILFRPFLANSQATGIDLLFTQSLQETHPSLRKTLFQDIIIIGGTSKFPNFQHRFTSQFAKIPLLAHTNIHHDPENADIISWLGMKKFVEAGLYEDRAVTQTKFFAQL